MRRATLAIVLLSSLIGSGAGAAELNVGAGSAVDLGTGQLELGCADLSVGGSLSLSSASVDNAGHVAIAPGGFLDGGSGHLYVGGNWDNDGSFAPGTGTVELGPGCGNALISVSGDNHFAHLQLGNAASGSTYRLEAGATQTITGSLDAQGDASNLLKIDSTSPGVAGLLDLQGSQNVAFVDVQDNDATAGNPIFLDANSVKGPNTPGWGLAALVPALGVVGTTLLVLALLGAGRRVLG